jgi:hypothetical protein
MGEGMGQGRELNPMPPRIAERIAGILLPPPRREAVLGDLHERYRSLPGYVLDCATAVPAAISCEIRRVTPPPFLVLEALLISIAYLCAGLCLQRVDGPPDLGRLLRSALVIFAALRFRDAYFHRPDGRWAQLVGRVYLALYFASGLQWFWQAAHPESRLFAPMITSEAALFSGAILVGLLRIWIESMRTGGLRGAR